MASPTFGTSDWTIDRKVTLVLDVLSGRFSLSQAARQHALSVGEVEEWRDRFLQGGVDAMRACGQVRGTSGLVGTHLSDLGRNNARLKLLLEINHSLVSTLDLGDLFRQISSCCRQILRHDYASLALYDEKEDRLCLHALDFPNGKGILHERMDLPRHQTPAWHVLTSRQPLLISRAEGAECGLFMAEGLHSACLVPLLVRDRAVGTLNVANAREDAFHPDDVETLQQVGHQIAVAVENARAFKEISELKQRLAQEKLYLENEIRTELNFDEVVGESAVLKRVLKQVETVADSDTSVLIMGETGTGKELIARAIHDCSKRKHRTFTKLNCAAIPTGLLESELFGHEKGAFTGAVSRKLGRLELAHQGTIFLDEVGDISLELQPKLLRVLQEREFERLGGTRTIHVDVRLVAATNRDLLQMVAEREFRTDLYYRLNVFPIVIPPLRERPEDVPILVRHFTRKYARRMNKRIETISTEALHALSAAQWPGNVRELENFIERAVILTTGRELTIPLAMLKEASVESGDRVTNLFSVEREHILRVLRQTHGVVGGPLGAAARLGLKRTTLISRMEKLGISRWAVS